MQAVKVTLPTTKRTTATDVVGQKVRYGDFLPPCSSSHWLDGAGAKEPRWMQSDTATKTASGVRNYGFRYYSPEMGRWLNRDPIAEKGGLNLYGMCRNDAVNKWDYLGWADMMDPWSSKQPNVGAKRGDIQDIINALNELTLVKGKKDGKTCFKVEIHRNAGTGRDFLVAARTCDLTFYWAHGSDPHDPMDPSDRTLHPDGTTGSGVNQSQLSQHANVNGRDGPQCYGCYMNPNPGSATGGTSVAKALATAIRAMKEQECCPKVKTVCLVVGLDNSPGRSFDPQGTPEIPQDLQPTTPLQNR